MTVIFSKKCELGLQAVLFLSVQQKEQVFSAFDIANDLKVPKEFISKVLQTLVTNGIIGSKKGKNGGFYMSKPPNEIRLIEIVIAIDGMGIFHKCVLGFPGCSVDSPCPVHFKWGKLRDETYQMLNSQTLDELKEYTNLKLNFLKTFF